MRRFLLLALLAGSAAAVASAPNTRLLSKAPIRNGIFDTFGLAHPSSHHTPWGGDFAVDFYGPPGSVVKFAAKEADDSATADVAYGVVTANYSACADPYADGGTAYQIALYDGADAYVGWVLYAHVDTSAVGLIPIGTVLASGTTLGHTAQFPWSSCYQVSTPDGVHTHVEMYNASDYACYVDWASGTALRRNQNLGKVGSDNAGPGQPCR